MGQAEPLIEKGKKLLEQSKADLLNNFFTSGYSLFLIHQGKFDEAIKCIEKYEYLLPRIKDYPARAIFTLRGKAKAFLKLGKIQECAKTLDLLHKLVQDFFGDRESPLKEDVVVLRILNRVDQSTKEDALRLQQAIKMYNTFWKGEQKTPTQAFAYLALGHVYEHLGDTKKALEAYLKSEEIYDAILKEKAIDDISQLYSTLSILGLKTKDGALARRYMGKYIDTFGLNHSRIYDITGYAAKHNIPAPYPGGLY